MFHNRSSQKYYERFNKSYIKFYTYILFIRLQDTISIGAVVSTISDPSPVLSLFVPS